METGIASHLQMVKLQEEPTASDIYVTGDYEMDNLVRSSSESESEAEEGEDVKLAEPSKSSIYNKVGLLDKLEDIAWPNDVDWTHKLSVRVDPSQEVDVNDDLARELSFYTQAQGGTMQIYEKFHSAGLPFLRPSDYYAEMVKSDTHMEKIKGRLLSEKRRIEEAEERKKARESKKIAKEVQAQKLKERAKQKKDEIESVKKWRKQRQQSGYAGGDKGGELELPFRDGNTMEGSRKRRPGVAPGDRSGGKVRQGGSSSGKGRKGMDKKFKKRESRDSKYGFGGRKGMRKQNTSQTTDDVGGFSQSPGNKKRRR